MSIDIDAREVLKYLNELGYCEISNRQLKEFIRDLKTLIKYDQKTNFSQENQENIHPVSLESYYRSAQSDQNIHINYDIDDVATQLNTHRNEKYLSDIFNGLYSTSTISSRAKECPRSNPKKQDQQDIISVQVLKSKPSKPFSSSGSSNTSRPKFELLEKSSSWPAHRNSKVPSSDTSEFRPYTERTKSSDDFSGNGLKPRFSFIRPRKPVKTTKSDPVALYQQYQEEWKKQKLPGEDKRYPLRWAIRERMLGDPDVIPRKSMGQISRKSSGI